VREQTPSQAKGRRTAPTQLRPREGTRIRGLYDMFMERRGLPIEWSVNYLTARAIDDLRDYYGLDIRNLGYGRWVLAGEWFGPTYIDYIADRIAKAERQP